MRLLAEIFKTTEFMKLFLSLSLTLISILSFGQTSKDSIDFSISFSSCYDNDFVGLSINGVKVFDNVKIKTVNNGLSMSNVGIYQNDEGLWLIIDKQTRRLKKVLINDTLNCDILFNKALQKFKIPLKSGNNIFIDNCNLKRGLGGGLTVRQFHGTVYLD